MKQIQAGLLGHSRAVAYRRINRIAGHLGTAINIQTQDVINKVVSTGGNAENCAES